MTGAGLIPLSEAKRRRELIQAIQAGRVTVRAAPGAAGDYAHAAGHLAPDDQVEASAAVCRACGASTGGTWQYTQGGRRIRVPTLHPNSAAKTCPGSFEAAILADLINGETEA